VLKTDKERIVSELANKQLEALRDELLEHGARFRIVKNTLTRRAAEQAGADALLVMLEGPSAIAFIESGGDAAAVAKALAATAKATNVLTLRGGILEGKTLSGEEVDRLATLPPLDVLRGQLVGAIVAPVTQLLGLISAPLRDVVGLIDARIKQLEEQGQIAEPATQDTVGAAAEKPEAAVTPADSAAAESADQENSAAPAVAMESEQGEETEQAEETQEEE
jgi:large subunit ribosomal protein L10